MHSLLKTMLTQSVADGFQNLYRGVEQLVARQAHNLEVIRSSRVSATTARENEISVQIFIFLYSFFEERGLPILIQ